MATEQPQTGSDSNVGEDPKPSLLKKVKEKAKGLKSKLKHRSKADSESTPVSGERDEALDSHDSDSSSDESSHEEHVKVVHGVPYAPLDKLVHRGAPVEPKSTDGSPSQLGHANPATLKSPTSGGLQEAVPTNYNYFGDDAEAGDGVKRSNSSFSDGRPLPVLDSNDRELQPGAKTDEGEGGGVTELLHPGEPVGKETSPNEKKQSGSQEQVLSNVVPQDIGVGLSKEFPPSALEVQASNLAIDNSKGGSLEAKSSPPGVLTPANSLEAGSDDPFPSEAGVKEKEDVDKEKEDVVPSNAAPGLLERVSEMIFGGGARKTETGDGSVATPPSPHPQ